MPTVTITFHELIQNSQQYGSDDQHMVSRAFFTLEVNGKKEDLHADIKQSVGSDFESEPLEVSRPSGYKGPLNYEEFRKEVEEYYRDNVGRSGRGIRIEGGANIQMYNNRFIQEKRVTFEVEKDGAGW